MICTILVTLIIGAGAWDQNTYLRLLKGVVENFNRTDCWICSQLPENSARGFPLVGATFPNTTEIYAALSTNRLSHYVNISLDQLQWKLEFEEPILGSLPVSCVQRCWEESVPKNSGGNKTDSKCGNLTFIGSYPNCSEFWGGPTCGIRIKQDEDQSPRVGRCPQGGLGTGYAVTAPIKFYP